MVQLLSKTVIQNQGSTKRASPTLHWVSPSAVFAFILSLASCLATAMHFLLQLIFVLPQFGQLVHRHLSLQPSFYLARPLLISGMALWFLKKSIKFTGSKGGFMDERWLRR